MLVNIKFYNFWLVKSNIRNYVNFNTAVWNNLLDIIFWSLDIILRFFLSGRGDYVAVLISDVVNYMCLVKNRCQDFLMWWQNHCFKFWNVVIFKCSWLPITLILNTTFLTWDFDCDILRWLNCHVSLRFLSYWHTNIFDLKIAMESLSIWFKQLVVYWESKLLNSLVVL